MLKELRIKFICINMLIAAAMLCIILGMVIHFTRQNLESESFRMMQAIATDPFQLGRPDQQSEEVRLPYFTLEIGHGGEVIKTGGGYYDLSDEEFLREIIDATLEEKESTGVLKEYNLRYQKVIAPKGQRIVFADMSSEQSTLTNLISTCVVISAMSLLAFFLISLLLANWAVKPVEKAWQQQRQFVADASHELKTPLTVILTNAELLQESSDKENPHAQFSESILIMAKQMRGLVESLLELARVDNGIVKAGISQFDFSELVLDAILPFEPLYFEHDLEIQPSVEKNMKVNGSRTHLRQVIEILLDNALKYSFAPGVVQIELKRHGFRCLLSVSNPGKPIPLDELKNIFKRFYRIDEVRSMNHSYGLGLSIAENIVKEHKGRIWAESKDGMNTFFVELPASS